MYVKRHEYAKIEKHNFAHGIYTIRLYAPGIAGTAKPGQFVMVYLDKGEHLLPRPISLYDVDKENGSITLAYVIAGTGTQIMSQWHIQHTVRVLGPIGNGFDMEDLRAGDRVALVGGGIGVAPLYYLARELNKAGILTDVYLGFRKDTSSLVKRFEPFADNIITATEDGSSGHNGYVTDLLPGSPNYKAILSCGPAPMLKVLAKYAEATGTPCQVSVEERMACGLGVCIGCVVKTMVGYQLCCTSGPVFDSKEVVLG